MSIRRIALIALALVALLGVASLRFEWGEARPVPPPSTPPSENRFDADPATGTLRASHASADGVVTELEAGPAIAPDLPLGFSLFPGAKVIEHARVRQGGRGRAIIVFTSDRPLVDLAKFHRAQAERAGVVFDLAIEQPETVTLVGGVPDGLAYTFTARREGGVSRAHLSLDEGIAGPLAR